MIRAGLILLTLATTAAAAMAADLTRVNSALVGDVRMSRVVIQPNGWGNNPASARRDLDRVMRIYEGKPGFRRDRYTKIIEIGRGKYQCDGRCSYLAPVRGRSRPRDVADPS